MTTHPWSPDDRGRGQAPRWRTGVGVAGGPTGMGVMAGSPADGSIGGTPADMFSLMDPSVGWDDFEELASDSNLPLLVKGILTGEDAALACEQCERCGMSAARDHRLPAASRGVRARAE